MQPQQSPQQITLTSHTEKQHWHFSQHVPTGTSEPIITCLRAVLQIQLEVVFECLRVSYCSLDSRVLLHGLHPALELWGVIQRVFQLECFQTFKPRPDHVVNHWDWVPTIKYRVAFGQNLWRVRDVSCPWRKSAEHYTKPPPPSGRQAHYTRISEQMKEIQYISLVHAVLAELDLVSIVKLNTIAGIL